MDIYEPVLNTVQESVDYLKDNNNVLGEFFITSAITEEMIPATQKEIKKFVLRFYNILNSSNNRIRLVKIPLLKKSSMDIEPVNPLLDYFSLEKECLRNLKKFIKSNYDLPLASYTGIFTTAIINMHNKNDDKLNRMVEISKISNNSPFCVQIPNECLTPSDVKLLDNINATVKELIKK